MVGRFLVRGMLVGIVAGLLAFAFAYAFGEPQIDRAIAFESQAEQAKEGAEAVAPQAPGAMKGMDMSHGMSMSKAEAAAPELVSRQVQSTFGLPVGVLVYSAAFGGLFSLVFAFAYGRVGALRPRATAMLLAGAGFLTIVLVPALKYPPNPPAVGNPETLAHRTMLFLAMLVISIAALGLAVSLARRLAASLGSWNAVLWGAGAFLLVILLSQLILPSLDEVPEQFPATVLWRFRLAALGTQAVMWAAIGLLFGALTERSLIARQGGRGTLTRPARG